MVTTDLFQVLPLYDANIEAVERTIVNQGGTSSGKTYSIMQVLFTLGMMESRQVITVVGQDIPNLKVGSYRDAKTILESSPILQSWYPIINEGERIIKCVNGTIIEFKSYADAQDAKSGKRDYLFVNEANGITYDVYWQLSIRTRKKIFIDYNPSARFWVHDEIIGRDDVRLIISDHRKNYFLTDDEHARIEGIRDEELWKVYARGLTGKVAGLVLTDWDIVDSLPPADEWKMSACGLDFGFTCFKGDTLITTLHGEIPIRCVAAGDYVLTRKGYRRVKRNIYNGKKEVMQRKFVKGLQHTNIFATFEHNFNANGKWKKYGLLTEKDKLYVLSNSMAWSIEDTQVANTQIITSTSGKKMECSILNCCITQFMRKCMERYQGVCVSITQILIRLIMTSLILLCSLMRNISEYIAILLSGVKNIPMSIESVAIQRRIGQSVEQRCLINYPKNVERANGAVQSLHPQTPTKDFAERSATTGGSIKHPKTMCQWFASIAEKLSSVINILSQKRAAKNVRIECQQMNAITDESVEVCDVYDLEIEDVHEYFANGILVHNCDPSALEQVVLAHGELWIDEKIYSTGLTNPEIAAKAKAAGITRQQQIIADCAEPKSIKELQAQGLWVTPSPKGADSIISGIDILKRYRIHVTRRSIGIISNLRAYKWDKDRDGNMTNKPEDKNNHGIDAIRYVGLAKLKEHREVRGVRVRY